ncbi:MAG: ScpA family protein [Pseudomonadota bacterium]|nr:ScpA family protein [Pseudomonadota bacterium]MEC9414459.1 ScpA family protein [Pseudomonadota bacterium]
MLQNNENNFLVDLDGFEGPLDLLLSLAKEQKVDLMEISILELANQYLDFVEELDARDIEIAADYLVMASWLAYLKSKLLLPTEEEEPGAEEMAAILAFRLRRLEAMRNAGNNLMNRDRIGERLFRRGMPESSTVIRTYSQKDTIFDIIKSYSEIRNRNYVINWSPKALPILSIEDAKKRLESMLGISLEWTNFLDFLPQSKDKSESAIAYRRSSAASMFTVSLELTKQGVIEINQNKNFGTIRIKNRNKEERNNQEEIRA